MDDLLPVIDEVKMMSKTTVKDESTDPFELSIQDFKNYGGFDKVFKRKVNYQISKSYKGDSGVSSSRIDEKLLLGYDLFGVVRPPYDLYAFTKLYEMSAGHYAAVNAKTANIVGLGFTFVETRKTKRLLEKYANDEKKLTNARTKLDAHKDDLLDMIDSFNQEDEFIETMSKVWRDYETTGNGYIEIGRNKDNSIGYIGHVPSQTLRVRKDRDGFVQVVNGRAQFFRNFGETAPSPFNSINPPNEVIHLKRYSPTNTFYGVPDIVAAQQAVAGNEYAAQYNLDFFENKAIPRHVITLKGARLGPTAESNLLEFLETGLKGQNHRAIFIPLPPDKPDSKIEFDIQPIGADVEEGSFDNYRKSNLNEILMVHRVPITKISASSSATVALAQDADKTFKEQVVGPEQNILEKKLNRIISQLTDAFEIKMNEMTLTDENTKSEISERLVKVGVLLPNEVRTEMGMQGIEGGDTRTDLNAKGNTTMAEATANRERDSVRSANATDSKGAARNPKGSGRTTP